MRAIPVVNHILRVGNRDKVDLTPMKVQKLLFFLHGWYLAITGEKLIDEDFHAWQYGPVVPEVYDALKSYGSLAIDDYIKEWDASTATLQPHFVNIQTRPAFPEILERVWSEYGKFSATQLSTLTHLANTPWATTPQRTAISNDVIRAYFVDQVNATRESAAG